MSDYYFSSNGTEHKMTLIRGTNKKKMVECLCMTPETTIFVGVP